MMSSTVRVFTVLPALLLASCATSPENCDPQDDGVFQSFRCQSAYAERKETLEEEVREMGRTTDEKKEVQAGLNLQLDQARTLRQEVEGKAREVEVEIARLWETNSIEETEHERLQRVLAARNKEWQEVAVELERMEEDEEDRDGMQDTIARLDEEKQELEELLSSLAQ